MTMDKRASKGKGILAVIFLLPIVFIVYFIAVYSSQAISLKNVNKVTVSATAGESAVFAEQQDIDFYVDMLNSSLSINSAMRDVSGETPVYITCDREDRSVEYKFYPSLNLSGCLLVDPEGKLYVLQNESAKNLLLREEFAYLYSSYFLPALNITSGNETLEIPPVEATWNYYKSDGISYEYVPSKFSEGTELYTIYKNLDNKLEFSQSKEAMPYELSDVVYMSDDGVKHEVKNISELDFERDTVISVSFTAKWSGRNNAQASGQAKYVFNILYDIPSVIEFSQKEFACGDVLELRASNLNEDEKVTLESLLKTKGIQFSDLGEGKGVALIPIGLENAPGLYTLAITTGVGSISESIVVTQKESGDWVPFAVTPDEYNQMLSLEKMETFEKFLADITAKRPETNHFVYGDDDFSPPVSSSAVYEYGQSVNLGVTDVLDDSGERTVKGNIYELSEGTSVSTAQNGEVVFTGNLAPTGNTVIIYHGYGIYTYYYHLESISVQAGELLKEGNEIGIAGKTGYTDDKTVLHYALSIDGIFVEPDWFE